MNRLLYSSWCLLIPIVFYAVGIALCPSEDISLLQKQGYAEQYEYIYIDSEGEENEGLTLIEIEGVGKVLTYRDVYIFAVLLFVPFLVIGRFLYGEYQNELKSILFGNCVIGLLLIGLSTNGHVTSTILYWLGIISANCISNPNYRLRRDQ